MTRKDFTLIAQVVNSIDNLDTRREVALNFASELSKVNSRFDIVKFVAACGASVNDQ